MRFRAVAAITTAVLAWVAATGRAEAPPGWRKAEDYSRDEFKPTERYSLEAIEAMVAKIRAEGRPVPKGHPRIFINEKNKDALRAKIGTHFRELMQMTVGIADRAYGKTLTNLGGHSREPAAQPVVLACGIIHQLGRIPGVEYAHTPAEYGADGVKHLMSLLKGNYQHLEYLGLPCGYDWLYDLLTDEQRKIVALQLLDNAEPNSPHVHPYNNPAGVRLLGALAVMGDGVDDARAAKLKDQFYNGMVFGDVGDDRGGNVTANHTFVPEGPGIEGIGYSCWYNPFYPFLEAWYDQTHEDYFQLPFFQNWVFHYVHISGNENEHQDKYAAGRKEPHRGSNVMMQYAACLARSNPTAAALATYSFKRGGWWRDTNQIFFMLRADPSIKPKSPAELKLPTTAHFRVVDSVFARNSWEGIDSTWVWFQSPVWSNVRDLGPVNDVMIWKHGGFLLTKRTQIHDYDGGNRTNTFVLYDATAPGRTIIPKNCMDRSENRGLGMKLRDGGLGSLHEGLNGYTVGMRYFEQRPGEYLYCFGDGSRAFSDNRLKRWDRQLVWFRVDDNAKTDHFVLFDRVTKANSGITEHMMLNFNLQPSVRDRKTNNDLGEGDMKVKGIWTYQDADRIVVTNTVKTDWGTAHGRAFIDTLLPEDRVYYRMGGDQERNIDLFGNLRKDRMQTGPLAGEWRVQIAGKGNPISQTYLHTIQATDATAVAPAPTTLLAGAGLVGARTGESIALFSPTAEVVKSGRIDAAPAGTFRVLICDLQPGREYKLTLGKHAATATATGQGTCWLKEVALAEGDSITISQR